ncbi:MAG TPA: SPOR domain-containing protein [Steroidobacteraceae bacterium]
MRNLFFALAILNLVFLVATHWPAKPATAGSAKSATPAVPTLELAKLSSVPAAAPSRCRSIGPFADAFAVAAASDLLRARGLQPRDRMADTNVNDGYWVYIGELTAAAQRTVIAKLAAAGIHDAVSMTQPEQSDRVSVGFFSDQTHAVRRAEQVRELGYKPVLDLHQHTVSMHWLDVDLKPSEPDVQTRLFQNMTGMQVIDCPGKAAGG